jgi:hypothetical protein
MGPRFMISELSNFREVAARHGYLAGEGQNHNQTLSRRVWIEVAKSSRLLLAFKPGDFVFDLEFSAFYLGDFLVGRRGVGHGLRQFLFQCSMFGYQLTKMGLKGHSDLRTLLKLTTA